MASERSADGVAMGLAVIAHALRVDGYDLTVEQAAERLRVRIDALDAACPECLSPATVLTGLMSTALDGLYTADEIDLVYPSAR
jgi:hypothetical protein